MRIYSGKIPAIAEDVVHSLVAGGDIEVENEVEVRADVESVLKEFVRSEREVVDEAKSRMEARGVGYAQLSKMKKEVAKERGVPGLDDPLPFIMEQILEMLLHSPNVSEVFAEDMDMRKKLTPLLRKHMDVEGDLDKEVRSKIKNLEDGTANFEVEYAKVMDQIKRKRGLT
jgi:uncharacterized protein